MSSRGRGRNTIKDAQVPDGRLHGSNRQPIPFDRARRLRCESDQFNRSPCLVNDLHSFFIHPATSDFDSRESTFDLTKLRRR
jgi:hypothetical protein